MNNSGQLGDGTLVSKTSPVRVVKRRSTRTTYLGDNSINPIASIAARYNGYLALLTDGSVYTFGYNNEGQLGIGNILNRSSPVKVIEGAYSGTTYLGDKISNPIVSISGRYGTSIAISADGLLLDSAIISMGK